MKTFNFMGHIERRDNYYMFGDNYWSKGRFSEEEAREHAQTMKDCNNCIDCINCSECWDCYDCNDLMSATGKSGYNGMIHDYFEPTHSCKGIS